MTDPKGAVEDFANRVAVLTQGRPLTEYQFANLQSEINRLAASPSIQSSPPARSDAFEFILEMRGTFEEIEKGEIINISRSTHDDDTPAHRFTGAYTPRKMTMRDAKGLAHHAVLKINRWLKENPQ